MNWGQGTKPSSATTAITEYAPTSVTSYFLAKPGAAATGLLHWANSSGTVTESASAVNLANADVTGILPLANATQLFTINAQTATYQVLAADFADCKTIPVASGTFTITLVASGAQPASGQCINIINYGSGVVTVAASGQNINGSATSQTLGAGSASAPTGLLVFSDGTNYEAQVYGASSGAGANTALSNLAAVAVNTALLPGTTNSIALGNSTHLWTNLFSTALNCGLGGTTSCIITGNGSTSGAATLTWPAVAGTASNAVTASNYLSLPLGTSSLPSLIFGGNTTPGLFGVNSNSFGGVVGSGGSFQLYSGGAQFFGAVQSSSATVLNSTAASLGIVLEGGGDNFAGAGTAAVTLNQNRSGGMRPGNGTSAEVEIGGATSFNPPASDSTNSANFYDLYVAPTITGVSSGNTTALYVNPTITTTNLTGTNLIAAFASAGAQKAAIDYSGNYYSGTTVGVSAGSFSAITAITTVGGIVTQLTGSSDARLKNVLGTYQGGLDAILKINPTLYRWNNAGHEQTGLPTDRTNLGFVAQNLKTALPEAVTGTEPSKVKGHESERYLDIDDRPIIAALVSAVQEQQKEIAQLKKQVARLLTR